MNFSKKLFITQILFIQVLLCHSFFTKAQTSTRQYYIQGTVEGSDLEGQKLALLIPNSEGVSKTTSTITEGKFSFSGSFDQAQFVTIEPDYNLVNLTSKGSFFKLMLEEDSVSVRFKMKKEAIKTPDKPSYFMSFKNPVIEQGVNNISYKNTFKKFWKSIPKYTYNYKKMDNLAKYKFPASRAKLIEAYQNLVLNQESDLIKLDLLLFLTKMNEFEKKYLPADEISIINSFFADIDQSLSDLPSFKKLQYNINELNDQLKPIEFKDFEFENQIGEKVKLSSLFNKGKHTILYFWTAACGICRVHNRKVVKINNELKAKGVNLINISLDLDKNIWKKASQKDQISWTNLYAGENMSLIHHYQINGYPTKVIFDKDGNLVDFYYRDPSELFHIKNKD